jgi:hypothetical protein
LRNTHSSAPRTSVRSATASAATLSALRITSAIAGALLLLRAAATLPISGRGAGRRCLTL